MNSTFNQSAQKNQTSLIYFSQDFWYSKFNSDPLVNILTFYALTPITALGVLGNSLSFFILFKKKFLNQPLYFYLRVYILTSFFINLLYSFFLIPFRFQSVSISNTYGSAFYMSYIYSPFVSVLLLYSSLLDICLILDRICKLEHSLSSFLKLPQAKLSLVLLFISCFVCIQYFFVFTPSYMDVNVSENQKLRLFIMVYTSFGTSTIRLVLNYFYYVLRDIALLILEIILNVWSIRLLKKHFSKKIQVLDGRSRTMTHTVTHSVNDNNSTNLEMSAVGGQSKNVISKASVTTSKHLSRSEQNATMMVLVICILSTFEHLLFIIMVIFANFIHVDASNYVSASAHIAVVVKHFANFPLLYFYNKVFKKEVRNLLRLK